MTENVIRIITGDNGKLTREVQKVFGGKWRCDKYRRLGKWRRYPYTGLRGYVLSEREKTPKCCRDLLMLGQPGGSRFRTRKEGDGT